MKTLERMADGASEDELQLGREAMESLVEVASRPKVPSRDKMERGYLDGCYDLCHSGHFNCIR